MSVAHSRGVQNPYEGARTSQIAGTGGGTRSWRLVVGVGSAEVCLRAIEVVRGLEGAHFLRMPTDRVTASAWGNVLGACIVQSGTAGDGLLRQLSQIVEMDGAPPVVHVADRCSVPYAIRAMNSGAFTVLEHFCKDEELSEAVAGALVRDEFDREQRAALLQWQAGYNQLTEAERRVLMESFEGAPVRATARKLGIDVRSLDSMIARTYAKLGVQTHAEAVRKLVQLPTGNLRRAFRPRTMR
jgi:FixJ family two-component response regulator